MRLHVGHYGGGDLLRRGGDTGIAKGARALLERLRLRLHPFQLLGQARRGIGRKLAAQATQTKPAVEQLDRCAAELRGRLLRLKGIGQSIVDPEGRAHHDDEADERDADQQPELLLP